MHLTSNFRSNHTNKIKIHEWDYKVSIGKKFEGKSQRLRVFFSYNFVYYGLTMIPPRKKG